MNLPRKVLKFTANMKINNQIRNRFMLKTTNIESTNPRRSQQAENCRIIILNPSSGRTNQFQQFFQSYSWRLFHVEYSRALLRAWHHWQNAVQFKGSHVFASLEVGLHQCLGKDDLFYSHDSKVCKGLKDSQTSGFLEFYTRQIFQMTVWHHPIFRKGCTN